MSPEDIDSPTLSQTTLERTYQVRHYEGNKQFRVTIPRSELDAASISNKQPLGIKLSSNSEGYAVLTYTTDTTSADMTFNASKTQTAGELRIPHSVGVALGVENTSIKWSRLSYEDSEEIHATTEVQLEEFDSQDFSDLGIKELLHNTQSIQQDGSEWTQEQFPVYLNLNDTKVVDWDPEETVGLKFERHGQTPSLRITTNTEEIPTAAQKTVHTTNDTQTDRVLFLPNHIVRVLQFVDRRLEWFGKNGELVILATTQKTD